MRDFKLPCNQESFKIRRRLAFVGNSWLCILSRTNETVNGSGLLLVSFDANVSLCVLVFLYLSLLFDMVFSPGSAQKTTCSALRSEVSFGFSDSFVLEVKHFLVGFLKA